MPGRLGGLLLVLFHSGSRPSRCCGRSTILCLPVDKGVDAMVETALNAVDNLGCPVDGQKILRLIPASPCAWSGRRCRNSLTTKAVARPGGDSGKGPKSRETGEGGPTRGRLRERPSEPGDRHLARASRRKWSARRGPRRRRNRLAVQPGRVRPLHLIHVGASPFCCRSSGGGVVTPDWQHGGRRRARRAAGPWQTQAGGARHDRTP